MVGDGHHESAPFLLGDYIPIVRTPGERWDDHPHRATFDPSINLYLDYELNFHKSKDYDICVSFTEVLFDSLVEGHQPFQMITELTFSLKKGQLLK